MVLVLLLLFIKGLDWYGKPLGLALAKASGLTLTLGITEMDGRTILNIKNIWQNKLGIIL